MQQNSQLQVAPLSSEPFAHPAGERSYDTDPEPHTVSAQLAIFWRIGFGNPKVYKNMLLLLTNTWGILQGNFLIDSATGNLDTEQLIVMISSWRYKTAWISRNSGCLAMLEALFQRHWSRKCAPNVNWLLASFMGGAYTSTWQTLTCRLGLTGVWKFSVGAFKHHGNRHRNVACCGLGLANCSPTIPQRSCNYSKLCLFYIIMF